MSTRRFVRTREPVGTEVEARARSTSKSAISREFVARTRENLDALMSRRLDDVRLAVMMIDGIELKGRTNVVALGITTEGIKIPLGLWEGSTENATVATALLSDLVDRGLDSEQGILFVIDGAKALRKAIRTVFGERAPVQRCVRHKECHEAGTSAAPSSLEDVSVREESRDAAVRWDRLGDQAGANGNGRSTAASPLLAQCSTRRLATLANSAPGGVPVRRPLRCSRSCGRTTAVAQRWPYRGAVVRRARRRDGRHWRRCDAADRRCAPVGRGVDRAGRARAGGDHHWRVHG